LGFGKSNREQLTGKEKSVHRAARKKDNNHTNTKGVSKNSQYDRVTTVDRGEFGVAN